MISETFDQEDLGVPRHLEPDGEHVYSLDLAEDVYLHVRIVQQGIDVATRLIGPDGDVVIEVDSHAPIRMPEHLHVVTTRAGIHELFVRLVKFHSAPGTYEARILAERDPELRDRRHAEAEEAFAGAYIAAESHTRGQPVPESAIDGYLKAASLWQELGNSDRRAMALFELATHYRKAEMVGVALPYFQESSELFSDPWFGALAQHEAALIWRDTGDPEKARRGFQDSLARFRELGDKQQEAMVLLNLGRLDSRQGRTLDALDRLTQARTLWHELGVRRYLVDTLSIIGEAYQKLGESELALDHHRQALDLLDSRAEPVKRATALSFMGRTLLEADDLSGAAAAYDECLRLRQSGGASDAAISRALNGLGVVEERRGNPRRALELYQQSREMAGGENTPVNEAAVLDNIASTYNALGESEQAIDLHRQAAATYHDLSDHEGEARSRLGLAKAHRRLEQTAEALASAESALALIERILESGQVPASREDLILPYVETRQPYFDFYIQLLMQEHRRDPEAGYDALALATSEQARARHLLEILAGDSAALRENAEPELLEAQRRLREEINAADRELRRRRGTESEAELAEEYRLQSRRERAYRRLAQRIQETSSWHASLHQPRSMAVNEIQRQLDDQTLLLEYHLGEERSFLWAVEPARLDSFELAPRAEIESMARLAYGNLRRSDQIQHRVPAERDLNRLSEVLLEPVADRLSGKRLLLVTSGALDYIPFAALPVPGSDGRRRLVEEHEILKIPSVSVLAMLRGRQRVAISGVDSAPKGLIAIFADAVYGPGDPRIAKPVTPALPDPAPFPLPQPVFSRIPFSRREADEIRAIAEGRGRVLSAYGFEARRDLVMDDRIADYRILHFAAHGILREDRPELSALILSRYDTAGRSVESRLLLNDVYDLDLAATLVVLSACESALGREIGGEGLMGLPRGFLYAGATQVLASLWKVQDESTAKLMTRFYGHLLLDRERPSAALRSAQRSMLEESPDAPYHWAGFVLQGDWADFVLHRDGF